MTLPTNQNAPIFPLPAPAVERPDASERSNRQEFIERARSKTTSDERLVEMADVFKCFADSTRLKIVDALLFGEASVGELAELTGLSQPSVSHHLKQLRQARLAKRRQDGKNAFYSLDDYHIRLLFDLCKLHILEETDANARR